MKHALAFCARSGRAGVDGWRWPSRASAPTLVQARFLHVHADSTSQRAAQAELARRRSSPGLRLRRQDAFGVLGDGRSGGRGGLGRARARAPGDLRARLRRGGGHPRAPRAHSLKNERRASSSRTSRAAASRRCDRGARRSSATRPATGSRSDWQDEHDRPLGPLMFDTVAQAREALVRDLHVDWPKPTRIVVVRDLLSLSAMTGLPYKSAQTTGTVAVAKWGRVTLLSPRASHHGYSWRDTIAHELTHLAVTRASRDEAPLWLQEGVAKREEIRWRAAGAVRRSALARTPSSQRGSSSTWGCRSTSSARASRAAERRRRDGGVRRGDELRAATTPSRRGTTRCPSSSRSCTSARRPGHGAHRRKRSGPQGLGHAVAGVPRDVARARPLHGALRPGRRARGRGEAPGPAGPDAPRAAAARARPCPGGRGGARPHHLDQLPRLGRGLGARDRGPERAVAAGTGPRGRRPARRSGGPLRGSAAGRRVVRTLVGRSGVAGRACAGTTGRSGVGPSSRPWPRTSARTWRRPASRVDPASRQPSDPSLRRRLSATLSPQAAGD